jgi:putative peptide zinc metalloprotease protein
MSVASSHIQEMEMEPATAGPSIADSLVISVVPGLSATRSVFRRSPRYILSHPSRSGHASVSPEIWSLLGSLSGNEPLTVSLQKLGISGRPIPDLNSLLPTLGRLRDLDLIEIRAGQLPIPAATKAAQPLEAQLVYFRKEFVELMPAMPLANSLIGWIFSKFGVALWNVALVYSLYQLFSQWSRVENPLLWISQFSASEAILLYLATIAIKGIHELSHAVAFRRMAAAEGLAVQSIRAGISFMLFMPFPFTDCTAAWKISSKYRRATIGLAGMYAETWIAIAAMVIWSFSSNPLVSSLCLQIGTIVGLSTLMFNLNPLAKLDGYYVVTDLLEWPNLQSYAAQAGQQFFQRLFRVQPSDKLPALPHKGLLAYWVATSAYRWVIFMGMIWLALQISPWLAISVAGIAISLLLFRPVKAQVKMLLAYSEDKQSTARKLWAVAAVVAIILCVLPFPGGRLAPAVAEMDGAAFVYAPRDVRLMQLAKVDSSGTLMTMDDPEIALIQRDLSAKRALAAVKYNRALEMSSESPRSVETARAIADEITGIDRQIADLDRESALLQPQGSKADKWDPLQSEGKLGSWISRDTAQPLGIRRARAPIQIHALVEENMSADVTKGQKVLVRLGNETPVRGTVTRIDPRASSVLPSIALGRNAGGSIANNPDDTSGRMARFRYVSVWIDITDAEERAQFRHGQKTDVRFSGSARPILWQLAESIPHLIQTRS